MSASGSSPATSGAGRLELGAQAGELGVRAAGPAAVRQDAAPVGLGAEVQRVPVPVLDHPGPARDERPGGLPPLAVVGGPVVPRHADGLGVGLGDQERLLPGGEHPVGGLVQRPDAGGLPASARGRRACGRAARGRPACRSTGCPAATSRRVGQLVVVHRRAGVGDAGGDELLGPGVLADDVGLPADELGGLPGLERPPGDVVLRLGVAVRRPQVGPGGQPVRPVDQAPLAVEGLDVAVRGAQVVDEPLEDAVVVKRSRPGSLSTWKPMTAGWSAYRATILRMTRSAWNRKAGWVKSTSCRAPQPMRCPVAPLAGDLRVLPGQPRRHGVGRRAEDDGDAALVRAVEDRLQPVEVEPPVLRLPGGPDRLADPDDGEVGLGHQVEVGLEPLVGLVLVVVRGAEQDAGGQNRHGGTSRKVGSRLRPSA